MRFIQVFATIIFFTSLFGCSHAPKLILPDSGPVIIQSDNDSVVVRENQQLFIEWNSHGSILQTRARAKNCEDVCPEDPPVTVTIIEANDSLIRVGSHVWKTRVDMPESYLEPESEIEIMGSENPTLFIPLNQVTNISIYDRKFTREDLFESPRLMLIWAGAGAIAGAASTIQRAEDELENTDKSTVKTEEIILSGLSGAVFGALVVPINTYFKIAFDKGLGEEIQIHSKKYTVNSPGVAHRLVIGNQ